MINKNGKFESISYLERRENLRWKWCGRDIPLYKLADNQLNHIKNFVNEKRGIHYGISSEEWFSSINEILKGRKIYSVIRPYLTNTFKQLTNL